MRAVVIRCAQDTLRARSLGLRVMALLGVWSLCTSLGRAEIDLAVPPTADPIRISAEAGNRWQQGNFDVWIIRGNCRIEQGQTVARADEAVLWMTREEPQSLAPRKITVYLEGNVVVELSRAGGKTRLVDKAWLGEFRSRLPIETRVPSLAGEPLASPAVYERAVVARDPPRSDVVQRTQYMAPVPGPKIPAAAQGTRRIRLFSRSDVPAQIQWMPDPATNLWIGTVDAGANLIVDGVSDMGPIDVSADRIVVWTAGLQDPGSGEQIQQSEDAPLEVYLEGNVVFRQAERIIYADRMYYDVRRKTGTVINAEILSPVRKYEGLVRLRSRLVQQLGPDRFHAEDAFFTSSRMGSPTYRLQIGDVDFEDVQLPQLDPFTGQQALDPITNEPVYQHERQVTGSNALLMLGEVPVFYWPGFSADLEDPTYYIRRARVKKDIVFGTQALTDWDMYQLLGIRHKPAGTDWTVSLDYMSKRGFGHGTGFVYSQDGLWGSVGPAAGFADFWGIADSGIDNLGGDRRSVPLEADYRYRLLWQHRQQLPYDLQLTAELGLVSDRNFLEEYYKSEWDQLKDRVTALELRRTVENRSWIVMGQYRLNDFWAQTDWLPRADHYWLGQPILNDALTWYEHSSAGYAQLHRASQPTNPVDHQKFGYLPWEVDAAGERLFTRQEIDWPFQFGPVKLVPYAEGELAHWGKDIAGDDLQRAYYQVGLRSSMPMWNVYPDVESTLLNVHGLAHKVVFEAEFAFAQANKSMAGLPLLDPLDDDSIEAFRRRFAFNTFGQPLVPPLGPAPVLSSVPQRFDERFYALRSGMASWVTSPVPEIADDLTALRLGIRQRWQTKRGMPDQRRIIDWIELDTNITLFPDETRDNYGRVAGLLDYDFRWHVGDRLTLVSDGLFDFFSQGQQIVTVGAFLTRPPRGSLYLGMNLVEGPIRTQVLTASYSYWMSPKWISSFGTSVDLSSRTNIGQSLTVTRVGEAFLISAGFSIDATRGNTSANFLIEPRFLPKGRLGSVGGARVPAAGAYGLD